MSTIIEDQIPLVQVEAAAGQTDVEYDFWIREATDLIVLLDGVEVSEADYDVTGVQVTAGGKVIFGTPLIGGEIVTVASKFPFSRLTGFVTSGSLRAAALNMELTYLVACILQLNRDVQRKFGIPLSSTVSPDSLEVPAPEDGKALVWDGVTGRLRNSVVKPDDFSDVAGYVVQAQNFANQAAASALEAKDLTPVLLAGTGLVINNANKATYNGKYIRCTNNNAVTITFGGDITGSFFCMVGQSGGGRVTLRAATGGAAMINPQLLFKTRAQGSVANVILDANPDGLTATYFAGGDLAV